MGRAVARLDYDAMDALSASTGDVVEIVGKRRTVAKCLPLYPSDEGKAMARIDGLIRNNAGVAIGDMIVVKKVMAPPAENSSSPLWRPRRPSTRDTSLTPLRASR